MIIYTLTFATIDVTITLLYDKCHFQDSLHKAEYWCGLATPFAIMTSAYDPDSSLQTKESISIDPAVTQQGDHLVGFFAIGLAVNILLMIAFVVWGVKQWHKTDSDGS